MDFLMDAADDAEEPEWLERNILGDLRLWQVMFICFAGVTSLIVMVCCCFRFRIPRTKQQIEADYQRRKITCKFRQQLATIQDANMDAMSLHDVLELLHEKKMNGANNNQDSPQSSINTSQQQDSMVSPQPATSGQKPEPQAQTGFAKLAGKVATLSKLGAKSPIPSPTSPAPSAVSKMDF
ncbi:TMIE protein domain-containing protein [Phthorimaea operculella]|nr:TMIE protein domain-containing protein [Phthorimaea operculella]